MNQELAPEYGISASFNSAAAECRAGMETCPHGQRKSHRIEQKKRSTQNVMRLGAVKTREDLRDDAAHNGRFAEGASAGLSERKQNALRW